MCAVNCLFMDGVEYAKYPQATGSKFWMVTQVVQNAPTGQPFRDIESVRAGARMPFRPDKPMACNAGPTYPGG